VHCAVLAVAFLFSAVAQPASDDLYQRGIKLLEERKLDEAAAILAKAVELSPTARAWKALGVVHATRQDYALAEPAFRQACRLDPREEGACYFHARSLYALDRYEESLHVLERVEAVDRDPSRVQLGFAQALEALGRAREAEARFRKAIEQHRTSAPDLDPRLHFGVFLFRQGRLSEALSQFERLLKAGPESARLRYHLGRTLYQLDRIEEAEQHLKRAVELNPSDTASHLLLSKVYTRQGRLEEAERQAKAGARAR
jgi:tetratricopeptide (TPR) repeat protein